MKDKLSIQKIASFFIVWFGSGIVKDLYAMDKNIWAIIVSIIIFLLYIW